MPAKKSIATSSEVLQALTQIIRSEQDPALKPGDRLKAVELLGKHYGLFEPAEAEHDVSTAAVSALDALVAAVRRSE